LILLHRRHATLLGWVPADLHTTSAYWLMAPDDMCHVLADVQEASTRVYTLSSTVCTICYTCLGHWYAPPLLVPHHPRK
jgi:hypothetical protein